MFIGIKTTRMFIRELMIGEYFYFDRGRVQYQLDGFFLKKDGYYYAYYHSTSSGAEYNTINMGTIVHLIH